MSTKFLRHKKFIISSLIAIISIFLFLILGFKFKFIPKISIPFFGELVGEKTDSNKIDNYTEPILKTGHQFIFYNKDGSITPETIGGLIDSFSLIGVRLTLTNQGNKDLEFRVSSYSFNGLNQNFKKYNNSEEYYIIPVNDTYIFNVYDIIPDSLKIALENNDDPVFSFTYDIFYRNLKYNKEYMKSITTECRNDYSIIKNVSQNTKTIFKPICNYKGL